MKSKSADRYPDTLTEDSSRTSNNPFLRDNFAPVSSELTVNALPVTGSIPQALIGHLLRNGPNPIKPPDPARYHWFTGEGMLHAIDLSRGGATSYRNRWVRTTEVRNELGETNSLVPPFRTAANTNVIEHAGRVLALEEFSLPTAMSPDLQTRGPWDFAGQLRGPMTAHPKIDPVTGELFFFGYAPTAPYLMLYRVDGSGRLTHSHPLDLPAPVMMHDFAITAHYIVVLDLPVCFDHRAAERGAFPFSWQPANGARIGLIERDALQRSIRPSNIVWIDIDLCYVYHVFNAYDAGEEVVLDAIRYDSMFTSDSALGPDSRNLRRLTRWTFNPCTRTANEQHLCAFAKGDFPRIDTRLIGARHRFGYWSEPGAVLKIDFATGSIRRHGVADQQGLAEPVFVPAARGAGEDEGWLLQVAYDPQRDRSDLLIIDAQAIEAPPVGIVHLPQRVPYGFHGSWIEVPERSSSTA